jgi:hypothetical protein
VVLVTCFLSLDLIFVLCLVDFLARLVCYFHPWSQCNLVITNSQFICYIGDPYVVISISSGSLVGLTFIRLAIEIWGVG